MANSKPENRNFVKSLSVFAKSHHETFWLTTAFLPKTARLRALMILRLDGEFHKIVNDVSEPMIARIRLQWWRDEADRVVKGGVPPQTVCGQALAWLLSYDQSEQVGLCHHIDAYETILDGHAGDYATSLFRWLTSEYEHNALTSAAGKVFSTANSGTVELVALRLLAEHLCDVKSDDWPIYCVFEFVEDWEQKRVISHLVKRFRILSCFLRGEAWLAQKLKRRFKD